MAGKKQEQLELGSIEATSEYADHLDLGKIISIPQDKTLFDYTKFKLPGIFELANGGRNGPRANDEWKKIGGDWRRPGDMLVDYIIEQHNAEDAFTTETGAKRVLLEQIRSKMNYRYDFIMLNNTHTSTTEQKGDGGIITGEEISGLDNIFKFKSQVNDRNKILQSGGPKDFFRFLFDFVVPPACKLKKACKKDSIRAILEKTPAAGKTGQCWKSYGNNVKQSNDTDYDGRLWKTQPPQNKRMHCYICEVKLKSKHKSYVDSFIPTRTKNRDFQCEHLFPFTEGMLFWLLYQTYLKANESDAEAQEYLNIILSRQKREYAPVCRHCNVQLKSSLGILKINPNWPNANNPDENIVLLNTNSLNKISGQHDDLPKHIKKYTNLGPRTLDKQEGKNARLRRLNAVFTPMVAAINSSLKNRRITNPQDLSKFLIYKYLFYFQDEVMEDIEKMLIGGGGSKIILQERKNKNNLLARNLNIIYNKYRNFINLIKNGERKKQKLDQKAKALQKLADSAKRGIPKKAEAAAAATAEVAELTQQLAIMKRDKDSYSINLKGLFSNKFGLGPDPNLSVIINKVKTLKQKVKDTAEDYAKGWDNFQEIINGYVQSNSSGQGGGGNTQGRDQGGKKGGDEEREEEGDRARRKAAAVGAEFAELQSILYQFLDPFPPIEEEEDSKEGNSKQGDSKQGDFQEGDLEEDYSEEHHHSLSEFYVFGVDSLISYYNEMIRDYFNAVDRLAKKGIIKILHPFLELKQLYKKRPSDKQLRDEFIEIRRKELEELPTLTKRDYSILGNHNLSPQKLREASNRRIEKEKYLDKGAIMNSLTYEKHINTYFNELDTDYINEKKEFNNRYDLIELLSRIGMENEEAVRQQQQQRTDITNQVDDAAAAFRGMDVDDTPQMGSVRGSDSDRSDSNMDPTQKQSPEPHSWSSIDKRQTIRRGQKRSKGRRGQKRSKGEAALNTSTSSSLGARKSKRALSTQPRPHGFGSSRPTGRLDYQGGKKKTKRRRKKKKKTRRKNKRKNKTKRHRKKKKKTRRRR